MLTVALICTHNGEKYLKEQVQSILNQSLTLNSVLIHDYNSMDSTREIIKELALKNTSISYLFFDFAISPCHSFLNSIAIVREDFGNYDYLLYLCDQDDVWKSYKNQLVAEEFLKGVNFVFHDVEIVDVDLAQIKPSFYEKFWDVNRDFSLPNLFLTNCVIGHTIAISSSFLRQIDIKFDTRIPMHDWYLSILVLHSSCQYGFIRQSLSLYRQHDSNILGASQSNPFKKILKAYRHGRVLILFQQFLFSKGLNTSHNFSFLFYHAIKLQPLSKKMFILLCLFFSLFNRS
jgi:glycosyltransferase involved in cell wall biosynthesis